MRGMKNSKYRVTYDQARDILARADYGVLSTTCDDGLPYGIPLCFALSGNSIYFHCATEGQKLDNIMHDNRVCLTAVIGASNQSKKLTMTYESAMAFGTVGIVYAENERLAGLRLLCEKYAADLDDIALVAYFKKHLINTTVLRMDVEYIIGKTHPYV
jgi:nitroimidazol reductase NimA-like FMN-containing flavoprotein (pyridoxamine 5'-phosphate oxidase superfamily)